MRRHFLRSQRFLLAVLFLSSPMPGRMLAEEPRRDAFAILDLDGNGTVTAEEMRLPYVRQKFDLIVGAKQGARELFLSSVYGIGRPADTIPYGVYLQFIATTDDQGKPLKGKFEKLVSAAVPFGLGDSYRGYPVVATNALYFTLPYRGDDKPLEVGFSAGRNMRDANFFEAVIGATAAQKLGLKVGDRFATQHGVDDAGGNTLHEHEELFEVVGILKPTSTADDRSLFVNFEGFYLLEGHALSANEEGERENNLKRLPLAQREVTLIGLTAQPKPNAQYIASLLQQSVNNDRRAMAIYPELEHHRLVEEPNELLDVMLLFRMTADRPLQGITRPALKRAARCALTLA